MVNVASTSGNASTTAPSCNDQQHRAFCTSSASSASASADQQPSSSDASTVGNDKVRKLADEILGLTVLEASWLSDILRKKLNIAKPAFGAMSAMPFMAAPAAAAAPAGGDAKAAPAAEEKKEKTEFDIKLESFSAEGKIKVIKEIRAITNLGLKEAKELVRLRGMAPHHAPHGMAWLMCGAARPQARVLHGACTQPCSHGVVRLLPRHVARVYELRTECVAMGARAGYACRRISSSH